MTLKIIILFISALPVQAQEVKEIFVSQIPESIVPESIVMNKDLSRIAYIIKNGFKKHVVVNGKRSKPYDEIVGLKFSDYGHHLIYAAKKISDKIPAAVVLDNKPHKIPKSDIYSMSEWVLNVSPDGKRIIYDKTLDLLRTKIVINGKPRKTYMLIGSPIFSPDSKQLAYSAQKKLNKIVIVKNGKETRPYKFATDPTFSPDSRHFAYWVIDKEKRYVIKDGQKSRGYVGVGGITFSPDSRKIAYIASHDGKHQFVVVNGRKKSKEYDKFGNSGPVFSPDSKHIAYLAVLDGSQFIVKDGKEIDSTYAQLSDPVFSPDSKKIAYIALTYDKKMVAIADEMESPNYYDLILKGKVVFFARNKIRYYAIKGNNLYRVEEIIE